MVVTRNRSWVCYYGLLVIINQADSNRDDITTAVPQATFANKSLPPAPAIPPPSKIGYKGPRYRAIECKI